VNKNDVPVSSAPRGKQNQIRQQTLLAALAWLLSGEK